MSEETFIRGRFTPEEGEGFDVDFNPESLQYDVTNKLESKNEKGQTKQYVTQSQAKLSMDLVFDTTDTGEDVRARSQRVMVLMKPKEQARARGQKQEPKKTPSNATFEWGTFSFSGYLESFKEVLDFFSAGGVPLRSKVSLTMTEENPAFEAPEAGAGNDDQTLELTEPTSPTDAAEGLGAPDAAHDIGAANGAESLRSGFGVGLSIGGGVSAGVGVGFSGGVGGVFGAAGGMSVGVSMGAGASVGVSFGGGASVGGGASFVASAGGGGVDGELRARFPELRTRSTPPRVRLPDPDVAMRRLVDPVGPEGRPESFAPGGRALVRGSGGMRAQVGGRIAFERSGRGGR